MGEGLGRNRDEMKSRADILSRQSFQKTEQPRALSGCVVHPLVHPVRMKTYEKKAGSKRKRAGKN